MCGVVWFKLHFNHFIYKIQENIKKYIYPGSDIKPKACTEVISCSVVCSPWPKMACFSPDVFCPVPYQKLSSLCCQYVNQALESSL